MKVEYQQQKKKTHVQIILELLVNDSASYSTVKTQILQDPAKHTELPIRFLVLCISYDWIVKNYQASKKHIQLGRGGKKSKIKKKRKLKGNIKQSFQETIINIHGQIKCYLKQDAMKQEVRKNLKYGLN